ncbi:MAG: PAS domain S-box protein [Oscillochloris sp.]|nr:PAS domain S-box protein [Oscillochloris sp.]
MILKHPSYDELIRENQELRTRLTETERVLTELTTTEHRSHEILDKLAMGVLLIDIDGRYAFANAYAASMFNLTPAELVGKHLGDLFPPEVATAYQERSRRLIASQGIEEYEATFRLPTGTRTFLITERGLTNVHGKGVILLSNAVDITDHKRVEHALRESERKLRTLFEILPVGVSILNQEGRVVFVNPALEQILDIRRETLYQGGYRTRRYLRPDGTPMLSEEFASTRAQREQRVIAHMEIGVVTESDRLIWTMVSAVPVTFEDWRVILVTTDITVRKHTEMSLWQLNETLELRVSARTAELARVNEELTYATRLKDEFLANMSHELRTPLNTMLGRVELLQEEIDGPLTPRQRISLQRIEANGQHLLTLINEILSLAMIDAGKLTLDIAAVEVALVCQQSRHLVAESAIRKQITLSTTLDPQVTIIPADQRWLIQILVNLLANAIKFTPEAGMVGLEVFGYPQHQQVVFTVWDTGIGIAKEHISYLFQPFVQIDGGLNRQYAGTGLGLTLVRRLTEAHQGSLTIESTLGQGSRFSVSFPWPIAYAGA